MSLQTTGVPQAIASISGMPKPSSMLADTNAVAWRKTRA
jgi:hypothetical protein